MSLQVERFRKDERGTSFEGIALSVAILAVAFVASADILDYMTRSKTTSGGIIAMRRLATPTTIANANLDDTPTASVPKLVTRSVLDPCTGAVK